MKKVLFALVAAGMTMTSCMNEEFPNATSYGQLNVNVSNDLQMNTRASVSDLSTWTVSAVGPQAYTLTSKSTNVKAGTYTVSAKSHASEADALEDNEGWGAAYYEGSTSGVVVEAGKTVPATVNCGTAKNARLKVQFSLISNFTEYSLTAANRNLVFDASNSSTALAYYGATEVVNYTLSYKYNDTPKQITGQITMKGAATENIISISSNDNGTISVTVNYDDTFTEGSKSEIEFDAATGEEVK